MSDPDQIRAEIERTRRDLGTNVDALADKVTPSKIIDRQTSKVRNAFADTRDRVMGAASNTGDVVADRAQDVAEKAKGNPIAVGLIAFGVGWLAASLVPASQREKQLTGQLADAAQPLIDKATEVAKDVAENLREPAQDALASVKETATDAADTVKETANSAAADVTESAQTAKAHVASSSPSASSSYGTTGTRNTGTFPL